MWHLETPSKEKLQNYISLLLNGIINNIQNNQRTDLEKKWGNYLAPVIDETSNTYDEKIIIDILTAKPARLFKLNTFHLNKMLEINYPDGEKNFRYNEKQLRQYLKAKRKKNLTSRDSLLRSRYDGIFEYLLKIFDYGLVKNQTAYEIAMLKDVNTCTYCNRQYTFTIGRPKGNKLIVSKIKPQFDHWYAHKQYPLLSLSFYNLIPSCSVCNSSVKGSEHYSLKTHVHPYVTTSCDPNFKFRPILKYNPETQDVKWSVLLKRKKYSKEDNMIKALSLDTIYDKHGEMEVKDVMDFAIKNNSIYLKQLFSKICTDFGHEYSKADVYRMLFGIEGDIDLTLKRPLSKLKRDILESEGIILEQK